MLSWISSWFKPADAPKVNDIEAAYKPRSTSSSKPSALPTPLAGRTFNFVYGLFTNSTTTHWWTQAKSYASSGSSMLYVAASSLHTMVAAPAPSPTLPTHAPPPAVHRSLRSDPEMIELQLPKRLSLHAPRPRREQPSQLETSVAKLGPPTPLPTPPITPLPTGPYYTIADFISYSPYQLHVNANYQPVAALSEKWLDDHQVHPSPKKRAGFEACNFGLLTAMCYADADYERFRVLCDYINCLFAFDDLTDEGGLRKDGEGTKKASDIIMNALHYPHDYDTEFRCGQVFSSFWGRAIDLGCSAGMQRRFLEYTDLYVQAVHEQVLNRAKDHIPDVESFIILRRDTGALKMCFAMGEFGQNVDIPDEVFECPLIRIMEDCANDVVVLSNDIYSYNIEQAQGDTCNIIEVAMKERGLDVQGAMDYAAELVKGRVDLFTSTKASLPSWGSRVDADVMKYLRVCEDWMTGGFYWSLESKRYFADQVNRVKKTLVVEILPKEEGPRGQISIPDLERA